MNTLLITGITVLLLAFSSCKSDCAVCSKSGQADVKICEKEYDSHKGYDASIGIKEAEGYVCSAE